MSDAAADGEYVLVRIDGEDAGRFTALRDARIRATRDGAWLHALAHLEFVDEDSGVVLERWSKRDYPVQAATQ